MKKIPTPALMLIAAFTSSTASGLLERWIAWFSGWSMAPEGLFACMTLSALIASTVVAIVRHS